VEKGRLYYATHRGGYREVEIPANSIGRDHVGRLLSIVDNAIEGGFLPAAPGPQACDTCDYRPVCGPHEGIRVSRKSQQRLEALVELRNLG
jgi:ATP-dependent helicase/nuclease subunit B